MNAQGGGDGPEAVMDGLKASITELKWREKSQRFIFHICDAPPHGNKLYGGTSNDPDWNENGCPCNIDECMIADLLKSFNI